MTETLDHQPSQQFDAEQGSFLGRIRGWGALVVDRLTNYHTVGENQSLKDWAEAKRNEPMPEGLDCRL